MSVVSIGAIAHVPPRGDVIHLNNHGELTTAFQGKKCVILLHWIGCGHCKAFMPAYKLAASQHPHASFYSLEVETAREAKPASAIPTGPFFEESGVPRVAVTDHGVVVEFVKGNDQKKFAKLLAMLAGGADTV